MDLLTIIFQSLDRGALTVFFAFGMYWMARIGLATEAGLRTMPSLHATLKTVAQQQAEDLRAMRASIDLQTAQAETRMALVANVGEQFAELSTDERKRHATARRIGTKFAEAMQAAADCYSEDCGRAVRPHIEAIKQELQSEN